MLSVQEFTAGALGDATPISLVLPRTKHEQTILIGRLGDQAAAIFLSGECAFSAFESTGNKSWKGLIVPDVNVEVDETTAFDPDSDWAGSGILVRSHTQLFVKGKSGSAFGGSVNVVLYADLPPTYDTRVAFSEWQIVVGEGETKRVLFKVKVDRPVRSD